MLSHLEGIRGPQFGGEHGEVSTRAWVAGLLLDLLGYTSDKDLCEAKIVEPACGNGVFLRVIASRVSASCRLHNRSLGDALGAVQAIDLLQHNVSNSRSVVSKTMQDDGWGAEESSSLADSWVVQGDFLRGGYTDRNADYIVGNPPYVRIEDVPTERMDAYRRTCRTMTGRADVYVGFYEIALHSLSQNGSLGFICSDRWMRNQYGSALRNMVARGFSVDLVMEVHDVEAFEGQVSAYPSITIISHRAQASAAVINTTRDFDERHSGSLVSWYRSGSYEQAGTGAFHAARVPQWFNDGASWPTGSPGRLAMLKDITKRHAPLEDGCTGTRVGIGVATGADEVFLTTNAGEVESDRLLPVAMSRDTVSGAIEWGGTYLVNPWDEAGRLVDLHEYPRLAKYLYRYSGILCTRYIAVKYPHHWYKTIDKVDASLTRRPKLLLPDMKNTIHPVLDEGSLYPHHNLYYIVSDVWDMSVLGGILLSKIAQAFVEAYSVKMRGGTIRFQAQYLRRIHVPDPGKISERDKSNLREAFKNRDVKAATEISSRLYGVEVKETWDDKL